MEDAPRGSSAITIVSGLPRSGTSMMMQMLEAGGLSVATDVARTADEDNPRGYYEHRAVKALSRDAGFLAEARGAAVKVVAQLLPYLPDSESYRVIFMERDMEEVVASQEVMLRRRDAHVAPLEPGRLVEIFSQQLREVRAHLARRSIPTLEVCHLEVLRDPFDVAGRVAGFLAESLELASMARVVDPTLHRQRNPRAQGVV